MLVGDRGGNTPLYTTGPQNNTSFPGTDTERDIIQARAVPALHGSSSSYTKSVVQQTGHNLQCTTLHILIKDSHDLFFSQITAQGSIRYSLYFSQTLYTQALCFLSNLDIYNSYTLLENDFFIKINGTRIEKEENMKNKSIKLIPTNVQYKLQLPLGNKISLHFLITFPCRKCNVIVIAQIHTTYNLSFPDLNINET